jgi:hypothetical protein
MNFVCCGNSLAAENVETRKLNLVEAHSPPFVMQKQPAHGLTYSQQIDPAYIRPNR